MPRRKERARRRRTPWRDNLEAITMAIVMALVLKYFLIEAYKIPTGSMQPTLMGLDLVDEDGTEEGIYDRILVDKLSYRFRDPRRWEVAVFRYPLDRAKNFVKRVVGMPGEEFRIAHGDLWARPNSSLPWTILRRPRSIQAETWKRLELEQPERSSWIQLDGGDRWELEGRAIRAHGEGRARFGRDGGPIIDAYQHGYPDPLRDRVRKNTNENHVGDLRVSAVVTALPGCQYVEFELHEGARTYRFRVPGPAAHEGAAPAIVVEQARTRFGELEPNHVLAEPWRLPAGRPVELAAQNLDDLLELDVDGVPRVSLEVPPEQTPNAAILIGVGGEGADLDELMTWRDIFYTTDNARIAELAIPEGHYFMLGDNTQDSSDSREWSMFRYEVAGEDGEAHFVEGNSRLSRTLTEGRNPWVNSDDPMNPELWLRDIWGERHHYPMNRIGEKQFIDAPLVPREMFQGRALAVFWPILPKQDIYRFTWIH